MRRPAKTRFSSAQLIAFGRDRANAVIKSFRGKPLHRVPLRFFVLTASRVLRDEIQSRKLEGHYEVGHYLIARRVIDQLKAEGLLEERHEDLFLRAIPGKMHYNPPFSLKKNRLKAYKTHSRNMARLLQGITHFKRKAG